MRKDIETNEVYEGAQQPKSNKGAKVAMGFIMLMIIVVLLVFLVANHYLDMINKEDLADIIGAENETFDGDGTGGYGSDSVSWSTVKPLNDGKLINILLIGQDRRPGEGRQRSDSMILCSINPKTKEIAMVSFLRDLSVELPGDYSANRLNAPYVFGGFDLLKQTLKLNFGITVDGCFEVDFNGFQDAIDVVGGVDIELSAAEANVVGGGAVAGMNHLNGAQALEYARIRKLDNDFGRTERQRKVLSSVLSSLKDCSLKETMSLAEELLPCMTTDLSNTQIMTMVVRCYKALGSDVNTYHVPEEGAYYNANINGMAVLVPDRQLIRDQLENYLPL